MTDHIAWHRNGGATIAGLESHVTHDSYCEKHSTIIDSTVHACSVLGGSRIEKSTLTKTTVDTSHIYQSFVAEAQISRCVLEKCVINSLGGQSPSLARVSLVDAVVEGDAVLRGPWRLDGGRIPTGVWYRPPRTLRITGDELDVTLTESTDDHALIACRRKPTMKWLAFGPRLGRMLGWTPAQVKTAADFFTCLMDEPLTQ